MSRAPALMGRALAAAAVLLLGACAADKPKPAALTDVKPSIAGRQVWASQVGAVSFPLQVAVRNGLFVAAGDDGAVVAWDSASGREAWRGQVGARLSAGVGSDGRHAAVVTRAQDLVVLDGGAERWRARLDAAVVTPPLVAGERVFVVGVDRVVHAFDVLDGRRLWSLKRQGDPLQLAQPGLLSAWRDTLLVGQGARLLGVDPTKGTVRWEQAVSTPRGTNEVERLADLVGPPARLGDTVCVRAFQNAVGCVDLQRPALQWSQPGGGQEAVGGDADLVVGADASDRVVARHRADGGLAWTSELLLNRNLSAPAVAGPAVVFGDLEGQVHFLSKTNGQPVLRLPTDGSRVVSQPVLAGTTLLVVTAKGGVFAFRPE